VARVSERAALAAEQLGFDQRIGQGAAVQGHEGPPAIGRRPDPRACGPRAASSWAGCRHPLVAQTASGRWPARPRRASAPARHSRSWASSQVRIARSSTFAKGAIALGARIRSAAPSRIPKIRESPSRTARSGAA
jgi:hypothetical protein